MKNLFVRINGNKVIIKDGMYYQDNNFYVITNQPIYNFEQKEISLEKIIDWYRDGIELANVIVNNFSIIIIDKKQNKLTCIQDINGDTIPIYFYKHNEEFMFTNKIINIINSYQDSFCINKHAISYFIKKGYIPNKETLVKNIYKVMPKHNLIIDLKKQKIKFIKKKIVYKKIKNYTTDLYINEFKKKIYNNEKNKNVFLTLSNGYDSNFIFSFLDKNKSIEAFTVGGIAGVDESKQVANNIKDYNNTKLNVSYVNENTLENYPDLIYNLEGAVYERGIFLQYELLNSIKQKELNNAIMFFGEGSDQIFSYEYYNKWFYYFRSIVYFLLMLIKHPFGDEIRNFHIRGGLIDKASKYETLTYKIIKKNGILMNNLGITTEYPYLNRNIINIGHWKRFENILKKRSHIKACNKKIEPNILKSIAKIGGATDPIALFSNCSYIEKIESFVSKSKYNILKINKNQSSNKYLNYLLKVLYIEIFEYLFIKNSSSINDMKNLTLSQFLSINGYGAE